MSVFVEIAAEIERLRGSASFEVEFWARDLLPPGQMTAAKTAAALQFLPFECPPTVARSVEIAKELAAYWKPRTSQGKHAVTGEFFLRPVLTFGLDNEIASVFKTREYDGIDLETTRVFDYYHRNGGPIYALLQVVGSALDDKVLVFDEDNVYRTSLRYDTYLQKVRLTRGLLFWQYLFCERVTVDPGRVQRLRRGLSFLEAEFPGDDYSDLWKRLERIAGGAKSPTRRRGSG